MSDAREKAVHKLAAVLTAFAASHVPDNAKRFVDAVLRSGPADPALVGALRATFRALGLVAIDPALVEQAREAERAYAAAVADVDGEPLARNLALATANDARESAVYAIADAVLAQLGGTK